ncbi:hypothetical protein GYMLUDRAFT_61820 [Collybiopsis luxurians FD-317 M1]|uniref:Uncharacterized protein n=1 Tax=Collybiopsis luxurians FD-317 M1 TaxID=944289 RepID=A0A0D0BP01_9AGAR|nr:hypothetical protein GYMLUDRAFT_61820 [Collybiopsis luxurians FD-317 M1]
MYALPLEKLFRLYALSILLSQQTVKQWLHLFTGFLLNANFTMLDWTSRYGQLNSRWPPSEDDLTYRKLLELQEVPLKLITFVATLKRMMDESICYIFFCFCVFVLTILWNTSYEAILAMLHNLHNHAPKCTHKQKKNIFKCMIALVPAPHPEQEYTYSKLEALKEEAVEVAEAKAEEEGGEEEGGEEEGGEEEGGEKEGGEKDRGEDVEMQETLEKETGEQTNPQIHSSGGSSLAPS